MPHDGCGHKFSKKIVNLLQRENNSIKDIKSEFLRLLSSECGLEPSKTVIEIEEYQDLGSELSDFSADRDSDSESGTNKGGIGELGLHESPYVTLKKLVFDVYMGKKQFQDTKESVRTLKMTDLLNERIVYNAFESSRLKYFEVDHF